MAAGTRRGRRSPHARASQETPPTSSENTTGQYNHASQKRFIVVDGANVAFESPSNGGKPRLCNILSVCRVLEERGYEPIVIVDAALRHKIDDPDQLESLIDRKRILQAPAGTDADFFVLETASQQNACVVSNDTYKDRIEAFPWIRERRVPVMFAAGEVQLYVENLV